MSAARVCVLATPAVAAGFALAGVQTAVVSTAEDGRERSRALCADTGLAVLLVEESVLAGMSEAERSILTSREQPIVVPFPSPAWVAAPSAEAALILEILRRAVGYRVRLQ
jgi:vacuolar-type H+-ATPase subunit F/Vma7